MQCTKALLKKSIKFEDISKSLEYAFCYCFFSGLEPDEGQESEYFYNEFVTAAKALQDALIKERDGARSYSKIPDYEKALRSIGYSKNNVKSIALLGKENF